MAITLWRNRAPFEGLTGWFDDIDTGFDTGVFTDLSEKAWRPAIDIEEKDEKYILRADLPGMKKNDIHVEVKDDYLTLRGERKDEHEENKESSITE